MRAIRRDISLLRPFFEVEGYFSHPKNVQAVLSDIFYFNLSAEAGLVWAEFAVAVFGFGFKLSFSEPFALSLRLDAPCFDLRFEVGIHTDWERKELLNEADEKRARFVTAVQMQKPGQTIDAADWEHEDARKARIRAVRRDFGRKFWKASPDDEVPLGNSVFLVFREDGVFAEVRPENPQSYEEIFRGLSDEALALGEKAAAGMALSFDRPVNFVSADIEDLDGNTMVKAVVGEVHAGEQDSEGRVVTNFGPLPVMACKFARHLEVGCADECPGRA